LTLSALDHRVALVGAQSGQVCFLDRTVPHEDLAHWRSIGWRGDELYFCGGVQFYRVRLQSGEATSFPGPCEGVTTFREGIGVTTYGFWSASGRWEWAWEGGEAPPSSGSLVYYRDPDDRTARSLQVFSFEGPLPPGSAPGASPPCRSALADPVHRRPDLVGIVGDEDAPTRIAGLGDAVYVTAAGRGSAFNGIEVFRPPECAPVRTFHLQDLDETQIQSIAVDQNQSLWALWQDRATSRHVLGRFDGNSGAARERIALAIPSALFFGLACRTTGADR
jgi:hypothetical protein